MDKPGKDPSSGNFSRRDFIVDALKVTGGAALLSSTFSSTIASPGHRKDYTVQEVIDLILKEVPGAPFKDTIDTIKCGDPASLLTGITTTMFATIRVIKETIRRKNNFIIAHEPTFYNHADNKNWTEPNEVVKQKLELLEKNKITVWRFHDYCHALKPDAISYGVARKAGWLSSYKTGDPILDIPSTSLKELVQHLKTSLDIPHVKVIGDMNRACEKIALLPGAWGGQRQISVVEKFKPDVLIIGETHEWETAEYIRDAQLLGRNTALVILGHSVSEEPGMEWVADWLRPRTPGLHIAHISSEDPFTWA